MFIELNADYYIKEGMNAQRRLIEPLYSTTASQLY